MGGRISKTKRDELLPFSFFWEVAVEMSAAAGGAGAGAGAGNNNNNMRGLEAAAIAGLSSMMPRVSAEITAAKLNWEYIYQMALNAAYRAVGTGSTDGKAYPPGSAERAPISHAASMAASIAAYTAIIDADSTGRLPEARSPYESLHGIKKDIVDKIFQPAYEMAQQTTTTADIGEEVAIQATAGALSGLSQRITPANRKKAQDAFKYGLILYTTPENRAKRGLTFGGRRRRSTHRRRRTGKHKRKTQRRRATHRSRKH